MEKKILLMVIAAALAAPVSALAEVSVNVNVGVPGAVVVPAPVPRPRVMVPAPPSIRFEAPPLFLAPPQLGFYIGVDVPYDIFFSGDNYYLYYGNSWYRSDFYNGPWIGMERRHLPPGLRKHRVEYIRTYRDREYRAYDRHREHYRGRHFRPESVRYEQRRGNDEWKHERKEERKHEKREMKEERRREKEEWKEEHRGHGRRD